MAEPRPLFTTSQIYHVYNRGIAHGTTFARAADYHRAMMTMEYYRRYDIAVRLSYFLHWQSYRQSAVLAQPSISRVTILAFCFMPNHYHFLLKQERDYGVTQFISLFENSYTRYFNTAHRRDGALFLDRFKSAPVESDAQLAHVARYIHLNPYSANLVKLSELPKYKWSSYPSFLTSPGPNHSVHIDSISDIGVKGGYKSFTIDQAEYQRQLNINKHLYLDL